MNHKIERDEALAKWQRECEGNSVPVTPMMRHAYRDGWADARAAAPAPVSEPSPDREQVGEAILGSPAFALRGLYKLATEYFIDGKPATPDEYIAWQRGIIEALTNSKIPDPKYYGTQDEDGAQHEVKCAYVDGWNGCRASILAKDASPSRECADSNPPFSNCSFRVCDLPGQCRGEGECHHPKDKQPRECAACAPMLSDGNIAEEAARIADSFTCGTCGMDGKAGARIRQILGDPMGSVAVQHGLAPQPQAAEPKGQDEQPSFTNPLTPYGMLVRALRIVAGTTLYDMAKALLTTPAKLSSMEFGRIEVTPEFAFDIAAHFDALGIPGTQQAISASLSRAKEQK